MILIGETIVAEIVSGTLNDTEVYTPWFPRHGDAMTSTFEVIAISTSFTTEFKVQVLEKNSEDIGDGTAKTPSAVRGTSGVKSFRVTGCKQLVRYKITLGTDVIPSGDHVLYSHFRILSPSWEATGAQDI